MNRKRVALITVSAIVVISAFILGNAPQASSFIWKVSDEGTWLLPLVGIAALVDSINPCAFSILLVTIAFLFSVGKMQRDILKIGGVYIIGIFSAYFLIGIGILEALHLFDTPHFMSKIGAGLLVAFGVLSLVNEYVPSFPIKPRIPHVAHRKIAELVEVGTVPTAFFLGALVGLCEFPCTGGPYLMVLGLLHDANSYYRGLGYLLFYNIIFILPLVLMLGLASDHALLERVREWQRSERKAMRVLGGIAMIILGTIIYLL